MQGDHGAGHGRAARRHRRDPRCGRDGFLVLAALNLCSHRRAGLDELDRDLAPVLVAHASAALAATIAATSAEVEAAQLRQALESRDVIGQAKGILMERRKISADEVFAVLRPASRSLDVKLAQVAQTFADRRAEI